MANLNDEEINEYIEKWSKELYSVNEYKFVPFILSNVYCVLANNGCLSSVDRNLFDYAKQYTKYISIYDKDLFNKDINNFDDESLKRLVWIIGKGMLDRFNYSLSTSSSVAKLVYRLLEIKEGDMVFDLGSDYGQMLTYFYQQTSEDNIHLSGLYGIENVEERVAISNLLLAILTDASESSHVKNGDALRQELSSYFKICNNVYDKGYCFVNTGLYNSFKTDSFYSYLFLGDNFNESYQEQWVYIDRLLYGLKDDSSRAVALVAAKSLMQTDRNRFVRDLLSYGYIEAIISLHRETLSAGGQSYLIVFSKNNKQVKIVDAKDDKFIHKKENYYSSSMYGPHDTPYELDVDMILDLYNCRNGLECLSVDASDLKHYSCLIPDSVIKNYDAYRTGKTISLCDVAEVLTGTQYTIKQFTTTHENTGYQILTASDIQDGMIDFDHLKYVENDKNFNDKLFAQFGDVIITTKSTKVKVAVVDKQCQNKIIVTGGMIIVRTDSTKLEPVYLQMFLESENGENLLKTLQTGTTILNLSPKMVKNLQIPATGIETQRKKVRKYKQAQYDLIRMKSALVDLERQMTYIIDDPADDE